MPINAGAEFYVAESRFLKAETTTEKIKYLEEMMAHMPTHKGAENLKVNLRQRLAKLRAQLIKSSTKSKSYYDIEKEGVAQVYLVGPPNSGKSTLITLLTNANPIIADYPFTTVKPEIGLMDFEGAGLQLIEIPAITNGSSYKNPELMSSLRSADLIVALINKKEEKEMIIKEFEKAQIMLTKKKPKIRIRKNPEGGISFVSPHLIKVNESVLKNALIDHGKHNAIVEFYEKATFNDFLESLNESLAYIEALFIEKKDFNKEGNGLEEVKNKIWKKLNLINVFTKQPGKDREKKPLTLPANATVEESALKIHKDFIKKFDYVKLWGKSAKYPGQVVGLDHELTEGDIVEFHTKK